MKDKMELRPYQQEAKNSSANRLRKDHRFRKSNRGMRQTRKARADPCTPGRTAGTGV